MNMGEFRQQTRLHPLLQIGQQVQQQGLVVLDNITDMPLNGEEYISPYSIIALCQEGTVEADYDMKAVVFHAHDFCIMRSGHIARSKEVSPDYRARFIVLSDEFLDKFKQRNVVHFNRHTGYYHQHPACHLSNVQFQQMNEAFNLLRTVSGMGRICREEMMLNVFHTIIMMRYEFSPIPENSPGEGNNMLSTRFYEAIVKHYRQSHNVDFYARLFHFSPKYFSSLIKAEIGIGANECIDRYITLQARTMLRKHTGKTVYQIAEMLGFSEQTSFSRFFKKRTGLSPTAFRETLKD